jgi:hypothetical protein
VAYGLWGLDAKRLSQRHGLVVAGKALVDLNPRHQRRSFLG